MRRRFGHLRGLIDDVGIWQHATGDAPAREHGYCLDDAARAAMVTARLSAVSPGWQAPLRTCCRFVEDAVDEGGARNFRDADGRWLDDPHLGDHVGRAVWALGDLAHRGPSSVSGWAAELLPTLADADLLAGCGLHGRLYALLGLSVVPDDWARSVAGEILPSVVAAVPDDPHWCWPEPRIRYDAGRVPEALLRAGARCDDDAAVDAGRTLLHALTGVVVGDSGVHRYPGHHGLGPGEDLADSGDEQPLEPAAFAAAHLAAADVLGGHSHRWHARMALAWFHGANRLSCPMVEPATDGCHDGLGATARNDNQGAESTLAYAATWLAVDGIVA